MNYLNMEEERIRSETVFKSTSEKLIVSGIYEWYEFNHYLQLSSFQICFQLYSNRIDSINDRYIGRFVILVEFQNSKFSRYTEPAVKHSVQWTHFWSVLYVLNPTLETWRPFFHFSTLNLFICVFRYTCSFSVEVWYDSSLTYCG